MKSLLVGLSLVLTTGIAQAESLFTYSAKMFSTGASCEQEASALGHRFARATGLTVQSSVCRSQQNVVAGGRTYTEYLLGLTYVAEQTYTPYVVEIDGRDVVYNPGRGPGRGVYATLADCLADIRNQASQFATLTGLAPVLATCNAKIAEDEEMEEVIGSHFSLRIEGFGRESFSRSNVRLYNYAPHGLETMPATQRSALRYMLENMGAVIAQEGRGVVSYYRADGSGNIRNEAFPYHANQSECETSAGMIRELLTRAGSDQSITWCSADRRLLSIYTGPSRISEMYMENPSHYGTFASCLQDREFVLSDVRYRNAIGALCAPDIYERNSYRMYVYQKGW